MSLLSRAGPDGVQICAPPCRYLCCETQMELREWLATFLFVQVPGAGCRAGSGVPEGLRYRACVCVCCFTVQATDCLRILNCF